MTRPTRRGVLGGLAALAAPSVPALAASLPATSPDADLIRNCARFLCLDTRVNNFGVPHPDPDRHDEEAAEHDQLEDELLAAMPRTPQGLAALARVALLNGYAMSGSPWDGMEGGIPLAIISALVPPEVMEEEARLRDAWNARAEAHYAAQQPVAQEPYRAPQTSQTPAEKVESWRRTVEDAQGYLRYAEAELAAAVAAEAVAS